MAIRFPEFDPIAIRLGPLAVHWYALAYLGGIIFGWLYAARIAARHYPQITKAVLDDAIFWITMGVILGGRLGYVLFYKPLYYLDHPAEIFMLWHGGMSFHGGFLGVLVALWIFAHRRGLNPWKLLDLAACVTPIGLLLGRLANFVNGELYGRVTDVPWGVVFPMGGPVARHPSQLYEAATEGVIMLLVFYWVQRYSKILSYPGMNSGLFLVMYGGFRFMVEFMREPDSFLGFVASWLTMGQVLCLPMIIAGFILIHYAKKHAFTKVP